MEKKQFEVVRPNIYGYNENVYFSATNNSLFHATKEIYEVVKRNIGVLKDDMGSGKKRRDLLGELQRLKNLQFSKDKLESILYKGFSRFNLGYAIYAGTAFADKYYIEWKKLSKIERRTGRQRRRILTLEKKISKNCAYLFVIAGDSSVQEGNPFYIGCVNLINVRDKDDKAIERMKDSLLEKLKNIEGPQLSLDTPIIFEQQEKLRSDIGNLIENYGRILFDPDWRKKLVVKTFYLFEISSFYVKIKTLILFLMCLCLEI